jgi:hypothetical protein
MVEAESSQPQISPVLIQLLKGVLYRDRQPELWHDLATFQAPVREYFSLIGLVVFTDESEGYAFLRQQGETGDADESESHLPRLIQRRPLSYSLSLLCVFLRKKLIEKDAAGGETRLILSREQIIDSIQVFLPERDNEAKMIEKIDGLIRRTTDLGFLRPLKGEENRFEVQRIIKALVHADWIRELDEKLREYQTCANSTV